mmetsp:Transcript_45159/g.118504  ORF Transcript_45159/g.118504 Transcript_45159/m.118504 type:complete len:371 (+) Transcript_45159:34-1146(+)
MHASSTNALTVALSNESVPHTSNAEITRHPPSRLSNWCSHVALACADVATAGRATASHVMSYPKRRLVIACFALTVNVVGCVATGAVAYHAGLSASQGVGAELVHHDCITSAREFAEVFRARENKTDHLDRPACVSGLMGLVQRYAGEMLNNQAARRISFAFADSALEKVLVYGIRGGRDIVDLLGLGHVPAGTVFRLLVWKDSGSRHVRGFWENLGNFMREIYGEALPDLSSALAEVSHKSFAELTGCNVTVLQTKPGDLVGASCSEAYVQASALFPFNQPCTEKEVTFSGGFATTCKQEINFLGLHPLSAVQLRAFLYNCNGFNSLFTGYGYTAEEYDGPLVREFWLENVMEESLTDREEIEFQIVDV